MTIALLSLQSPKAGKPAMSVMNNSARSGERHNDLLELASHLNHFDTSQLGNKHAPTTGAALESWASQPQPKTPSSTAAGPEHQQTQTPCPRQDYYTQRLGERNQKAELHRTVGCDFASTSPHSPPSSADEQQAARLHQLDQLEQHKIHHGEVSAPRNMSYSMSRLLAERSNEQIESAFCHISDPKCLSCEHRYYGGHGEAAPLFRQAPMPV